MLMSLEGGKTAPEKKITVQRKALFELSSKQVFDQCL